MRVYLDNAATTKVDPAVFEAMTPYLMDNYGNPSSIHQHGREAKAALETSRRKIASYLNAAPSEIFFTSGGTEADNMALVCSIDTKGIKHAYTSKVEHHAVLHTLETQKKAGKIELTFAELDELGHVNLDHLEEWLKSHPNALVSLMHANNEIGNLLDIDRVGAMCQEYGAVFHSDTVQAVGHYKHDLQQLKVNSLCGAAHKFHGPKGSGFLYLNSDHKIHPLIHGGAQERNMRGGTENIAGIVGLAKALELAYEHMDEHRTHIEKLKARMIQKLKEQVDEIAFNGDSANMATSLYTVLNVCLPPSDENEMLIFNLDINKVSASGGSACSSGSQVGSHVLAALKDRDPKRGAIRFSFSKFNTTEDIDYAVGKLAEIVNEAQMA
ncbi:MAG: cysteine desulfurase family protein [Cyclobacteriaceae bacterium]